ncbi:unnamed protein product [Pseudo-nitzschia multistriata]|uniref:LysM domain-containing protein n=1 Tax=Pseudo-nitzschia multistriata TaxID=183589 RepID=A0A448YUP5_9STRA|nr:unnamed protein product [Pseudo-nitzschia multistriata]
MPEEKQKQQDDVEGRLFPFKVKKFLSGVASAGQAALKEAQERHQSALDCNSSHDKPPIPGRVLPKPKDPSQGRMSGGVTESSKVQNLLRTPPKPTTSNGVSIAVSPEIAADMSKGAHDHDWEMLSTGEKASTCSEVFVSGPRAGSVRSIRSLDHDSSNQTTLSIPFKIQRTNSSSTIDSQDNVLGPSGKGILGVDYMEHVVLPTDTLQGICIAYKVSASQLRRANHFSGTLHSAPKKLLIPLSKQALRTGFIRVQDTDTKEYKLHYFQAEFPDISAAEAKGYLELADWELKEAVQSAKEDREWEIGDGIDDENGQYQAKSLKSGQIGIKLGFSGNIPTFNLMGSGHSSSFKLLMKKSNKSYEKKNESHFEKETTIVHSRPPAIASKSVQVEDLFNAADQHNSYGFELKPIPKRNDSFTN